MKRGSYWLGKHHTEETKAKMRGRRVTEKVKAKLRLMHLGTHHSEETKAKMRLAHSRRRDK